MSSDKDKLVRAIAFEYELLSTSYKTFLMTVELFNKNESCVYEVHIYRSYSQIIQHLYEFMKAQVAWQYSKTKSEKNEDVKKFIVLSLQKLSKSIPEEIHSKINFENFADDLRKYRNKVSGHVLKDKFEEYPLDDFYTKNHVYIVWLIQSADEWWATDYEQLTDHPAIKKFANIFSFKAINNNS